MKRNFVTNDFSTEEFSTDNSNTDDIVLSRPLGFERIIHIDEEILEPSKYRLISNIIRNSTQMDVLRFVINSDGGSLSSTMQIINLILKTPALTIAELYRANSAAGILTLCCDAIEIGFFAEMLIHSISTGIQGKSSEIKSYIDFSSKMNTNCIHYFYETFLTNDEIKKVIDGQDIWLHSEDIEKRLRTWVPLKVRKTVDNIADTSKKVKIKKIK